MSQHLQDHPTQPPQVYVIGTASLDVLHLPRQSTARAAGGAGLYTALAAAKTGIRAGLFAPRPEPLPESLEPAAAAIRWSGPQITPEETPRLEIEHHGQGRATLLNASWGAEAALTPAQIPLDIVTARFVHIAALSSAQRQQQFLTALRARQAIPGQPGPKISVGTYGQLVQRSPGAVLALLEQADLFFMNENEAKGLFGSISQIQTRPGTLLFITLANEGAIVIEGDRGTQVAGQPVAEVDPTGAGDTFCGAVLGRLARGETPLAAAQYGVKLAAQTVGAIGPAALLPTTAA